MNSSYSFIPQYLCTCFTLLGGTIPPLLACTFPIHLLKPSSSILLWRRSWFPLSLHLTNRPGFKSQDQAHLVSSQEVIIVFSNSWSWPGFFSSLWQLDQVQCERLEINYAVVKPLIGSKILGCSNVSYVTYTLCNGQEDLTVSADLEVISIIIAHLPHFYWGIKPPSPSTAPGPKQELNTDLLFLGDKKRSSKGRGSWESFPYLLY